MDNMMNTMPPGGGKGVTMTSREIADLTGKQHKHVKRDIENMLVELGEDTPKFGRIYFDSMNREQIEYHLDRDLTETLLLGYSAVARLKVIQRMREMEQALTELRIPTTAEAFANAFTMIADSQKVQAQQNAAIAEIGERVGIIEQLTPLKTKPQNAESRSDIRARMNEKYGLSEVIVDIVLDKLPYSFRPFGMVKNSHEEAKGSSYAVYWIRDVTAHFKRFVSECIPHSATMFKHPAIVRAFKLVTGGDK